MHIVYIHSLDLAVKETSETFVIYNALSLCRHVDRLDLVLINRAAESEREIICRKFNLEALPSNLQIHAYAPVKRSKFGFYLYARKLVNKLPGQAKIITRSQGVLKWLFKWQKARHQVFYETHDYFFDLSKRVDYGRKDRKKKSVIERKYLPKVTGIICSNDYQAVLYRQDLPKQRIESFPTGIHQTFKIDPSRRKKCIAYIGTLEPRLGMDRVIKLIEHLPDDIELKIIGGRGKQDVAQFKGLFKEGKVPDNVTITGWLNKKQLHEVLQEVRLGLLPLYLDQNRFALPLKIFDYFAFGIPVFSTRLPAIQKIILDDKTGFYVDWEDSSNIAKLVVEILEDPDRWASLSREVYQLAQNMTWDQRARNQIEYLKTF
jgi:glycosyltransferase involved in cell wall biosynthesis